MGRTSTQYVLVVMTMTSAMIMTVVMTTIPKQVLTPTVALPYGKMARYTRYTRYTRVLQLFEMGRTESSSFSVYNLHLNILNCSL